MDSIAEGAVRSATRRIAIPAILAPWSNLLAAAPRPSFTYTSVDHYTETFAETNSSTVLFDPVSIVDPDSLTTYYSYDGEHDLTQVRTIDGATTTIDYSATTDVIYEPGGRDVTLNLGSGNLTQLVDEDGNGRTFTYDGEHQLTRDQWSPYDTSFSYDGTTGLLTEVNQGAGETYTVAAQAGQGLQTSAALNASANATATITDAYGDPSNT